MIRQIAMGSICTLLLTSATLLAQSHPIFHVKKVSDEITISQDLRVGAFVLPAGTYRIDCDHATLSFTNLTTDKKVDMPCLGKELNELAKSTELYIATDADGSSFLTKMYLKGSPVEHYFD